MENVPGREGIRRIHLISSRQQQHVFGRLNIVRTFPDRMCRFLRRHDLYTGPVRPEPFRTAPGPRRALDVLRETRADLGAASDRDEHQRPVH